MTLTNIYRVLFHYEETTLNPDHAPARVVTRGYGQDSAFVVAASPDPAGLTAILQSNGKGVAPAGSVLVFDSISNSGPQGVFM